MAGRDRPADSVTDQGYELGNSTDAIFANVAKLSVEPSKIWRQAKFAHRCGRDEQNRFAVSRGRPANNKVSAPACAYVRNQG